MLNETKVSEKITIISYLILIGFMFFLLRLWHLQVLKGDEYRKISESNRLRIIRVPGPRGIIYDRNGFALVKNTPFFCVSVIPEEFDRNSLHTLSKLLNLPEGELEKKIAAHSKKPFKPIRVKEGISFSEVNFLEARRSDYPGLIIEIEVSRDYLYGGTGAHIIGYLGKMSPKQSRDPQFSDVPLDAFIGQWGIEKVFDESLRGKAGQKIIEVDALGREIRVLKELLPVKGNDLTLSIDIALQKEAENAFGGKTGALVALQPQTGELLGLVSSPSFDPNQFAQGIGYDEWNSLSQNRKLPMLNRAIQSQYPPGSTFKIITAIAGLEEGVISSKTTHTCNGGIHYGKWHFGCWKKEGHRTLAMHRAMVESCDVFFYETGMALGIDRIYDYATRFGLGKPMGISLGSEKKGLIPNSRWKRETMKTPWYPGETLVNAIGQGYVAATPLQLAGMISGVSNGGRIYQPSLLKDSSPVLLTDAGIHPKTLETIKKSLAGVVNEPNGTGWTAKSHTTLIAGKTGTAQVVRLREGSKTIPEEFRDHALFVAFAPLEKPDIALSVIVEHGGHGGAVAAPIAKKAVETYLLPAEKKKELLRVQD